MRETAMEPRKQITRNTSWVAFFRTLIGVCICFQIIVLIVVCSIIFGMSDFGRKVAQNFEFLHNTPETVFTNPVEKSHLENETLPAEKEEGLERLLKQNPPVEQIEPMLEPPLTPPEVIAMQNELELQAKAVAEAESKRELELAKIEKERKEAELAREIVDRKMDVFLAESLLQESRILFNRNPARSLLVALHAVEMYEKLEQSFPARAEPLLKQATAMLAQTSIMGEEPFSESNAICVSSDGYWFVYVDTNHEIWAIDMKNFDLKSPIKYQIGASSRHIKKLLITPDNTTIIGGRDDGSIMLWKLNINEPSVSGIALGAKIPNMEELIISPNGKWLAGFGYSPELESDETLFAHAGYLWDLSKLERTLPEEVLLRGHVRPIRTMAISDDSRWLITGSDDKTARVYDLFAPFPAAQQTILKGHTQEITSVAFGPKGRWIATGSRDNTVRIWGLNHSVLNPLVLPENQARIIDLAVSPDGSKLASFGMDKHLRIWNTEFKTPPVTIGPIRESVREIRFSEDGKTLFAKSKDKLGFWSMDTEIPGEIYYAISASTAGVINDFTTACDSRWLIISESGDPENTEEKGCVRFWPLQPQDLMEVAKYMRDTQLSGEQNQQAENYVNEIKNLIRQSCSPDSQQKIR